MAAVFSHLRPLLSVLVEEQSLWWSVCATCKRARH